MVNATQKDVYELHDIVQYACVNDTFAMTGTDSIKCMYSGQWSQPPPKCFPVNNSGIKVLYVLLPVIFFLLLVLFIFIYIITYKRKTSPDLLEERIELDNTLTLLTANDEPLLPSKRQQESTLSLDSVSPLKRNREFDAFVVYHFDTDHGFVTDILIPHSNTANLKLKIHGRDFEPGRKIDENIEEAIKSSNNAIILMPAGFTTSEWCADEFTHCYIEHVEDPAFKLFIIVMEPVGILTDMTPNMKKLLNEQTYLELQDPDLFTKLSRYLKPDDDNDANDSD